MWLWKRKPSSPVRQSQKVNSLQLAAAKVLAKHNANLFSANGAEVYVKHIPLGRNVVRQLYEWYNPIIQKRNANKQFAARRISHINYFRTYGINTTRRLNERARILRPNNLKMKYRNLKVNSNEYKKILREYLENMHGKLRKNIRRRRDIHPGNPLVLRAIPFTSNIAGRHEMLTHQEYNNYVNKYKKAIMNTPLLHANPNKRKALINLFTKSTINTKAKNINKAFKLYYERSPRKRNVF